MTEHSTPPATDSELRRTWRERVPRLPRSRRVVAAGAVVAGLTIGGAAFGAGYAVGDGGPTDTATTQPTGDWGGRGPDGDRGAMGGTTGEMGGQPGGPPGGPTHGSGGTTGEAPDFDGDGEPGTDDGSGTAGGSASDSATQDS